MGTDVPTWPRHLIPRLIESNVIGIAHWAWDGRVIEANDAALTVIGYDRDDLLSGRVNWRELTPPEWRYADERALDQIRAKGAAHPYEKEYVRKDGSRVPVLIGPAGFDETREEGVAFLVDLTEQKEAEKRLKLMVDELNHRVKNTLATVLAISAQSLRTAPSLEAFRQAFQGRLMALSKTHNLLNQTCWTDVGLRDLVEQALGAYADRGDDRVLVEGEDVRVGPVAAVTLGLALHELATNAAKYGSLSVPTGQVQVTWRRGERGRLRLDWEEFGGPVVQPPSQRGFGSELIQKVLASELRGEASLEFPPQGVRCTMTMALDRVSAH
jgi:PAS domain S-box-containing protein